MTQRSYLLCPPEHFAVEYTINPWMDPQAPIDVELAHKQWTAMREALAAFGHTVHVLTPMAGLPDMVYAANGAFSMNGVVYGARFRYPQRAPEAAIHRAFYDRLGWTFAEPTEVNEGEGDFAFARGFILAGHGFRTAPTAHTEAQEVLGRPVISLRLVDPRLYHLDTALAALTDDNIVYFPGAFSDSSQRVLAQLFPDAMIAEEADALAFGLNLVSDGHNVFLNAEAAGLTAKLAAKGFNPVPLDLSELKKGGGSVKCCVAELRPRT